MYYGSRASWNLRDSHMFDTLKALLDFHGPNSKAVVWAHNSHIGDARATEMSLRGEHNIGQLCREKFGEAAYLVGFGTDSGTVAASSGWDGPMEIKTVRHALPHSYERICHDTGVSQFMLPVRDQSSASLINQLAVPIWRDNLMSTCGLTRPKRLRPFLRRNLKDCQTLIHSDCRVRSRRVGRIKLTLMTTNAPTTTRPD
jgi:erythromycin esterase-like protein